MDKHRRKILHSIMGYFQVILVLMLLVSSCSSTMTPTTAPVTTTPPSESPEPLLDPDSTNTPTPESSPTPTSTPINMNWVIHELEDTSRQLRRLMDEYGMAIKDDNTGYLRHVFVNIRTTNFYRDVPIEPLIYALYYLDRAQSLAEKNKLPDEIDPRKIEMGEISNEVEDAIGCLNDQCLVITFVEKDIVDYVRSFNEIAAERWGKAYALDEVEIQKNVEDNIEFFDGLHDDLSEIISKLDALSEYLGAGAKVGV